MLVVVHISKGVLVLSSVSLFETCDDLEEDRSVISAYLVRCYCTCIACLLEILTDTWYCMLSQTILLLLFS